MASKIPVTVLTGFLGAGKTTLLNRILSEHHGQRIAVIENEFGEVGIDQALVINADEEIFEMNNGCICCTVRGDLIRILGQLLKRRDKFDRILVETTGMADPGPVAQTFFMDEDMKAQFALDGLVTVVDAKHLLLHLDDSDEAQKQVAFADVILLNKCDLVSPDELDAVEQRVRRINAVAKLIRTTHAAAPINTVLDVGGFDLSRAIEVNPDFLEPEYPFEWAGLYKLDGAAELVAGACGHDHGHDHHHHHVHDEHHLKLALLPVPASGEEALKSAADKGIRAFANLAEDRAAGSTIEPSMTPWRLDLHGAHAHFPVRIAAPGHYVLLSEHAPEEFHLTLKSADGKTLRPVLAKYFEEGHSHDEAVTSVGIRCEGQVDSSLFSGWISAVLSTQGNDIFRSKGILNVAGRDKRYVFQGVHMVMDGRDDAPWGDAPRNNTLVFIGKNLDRAKLNEGFRACLRQPAA
ncbi:MAG: GTP-binding protein [Stagnimonas sp.]|nr:GTP-binding protein [Stagnimonas sp.]